MTNLTESNESSTARNQLLVRTGTGFLSIPLTGDPRADSLLRRFAARGGALVLERRAA